MKLFALGFCSTTLGIAGMAFLPRCYFWVFAFCFVSGFLCQLAGFWQTYREHMAFVRQLKDYDKWQHDIQRQYAEIDEADGERKVKLIKDVLSQLESYGK